MGQAPVRAVSNRTADVGWITPDPRRPMRQIRTFTPRAPLHKHAAGYTPLGHNRGGQSREARLITARRPAVLLAEDASQPSLHCHAEQSLMAALCHVANGVRPLA